jgi:hypothetical protein
MHWPIDVIIFGHETFLSTQCVKPITNTAFPNVPYISEAVFVSASGIAEMLLPKHEWLKSPFILTTLKNVSFHQNNCVPGLPITLAWTVFARSNTGIVSSSPTRGMDVCLCLFCVVLCIGRGLARGWSPRPKSPADTAWFKKLKKRARFTRVVGPQIELSPSSQDQKLTHWLLHYDSTALQSVTCSVPFLQKR